MSIRTTLVRSYIAALSAALAVTAGALSGLFPATLNPSDMEGQRGQQTLAVTRAGSCPTNTCGDGNHNQVLL